MLKHVQQMVYEDGPGGEAAKNGKIVQEKGLFFRHVR